LPIGNTHGLTLGRCPFRFHRDIILLLETFVKFIWCEMGHTGRGPRYSLTNVSFSKSTRPCFTFRKRSL
jgi:hypothetical protein